MNKQYYSFIRLCIRMGALWIVCCILSCKQGHVPNDTLPELFNDTGVNVSLVFDPNGGYWISSDQTGIKTRIGNAGTPLRFTDVPQKAGVLFDGWNFAGGTLPETFPKRKTVYRAVYRSLKQDEAFYTVEHWLEHADDADFALQNTDTETGVGTIGSSPVVAAKTYAGFTYRAEQSDIPEKIAADGSTKAVLRYTRVQVTLSFNLDGGSSVSVGEGNTVSGKYGAKLTMIAPTKDNHVFKGWQPPLPETFPSEDQSYTALWESTLPPPGPAINLIENADFSEMEAASGVFASYWGQSNPQSPKTWKTWAKEHSTTDVHFKAENGSFSVTAGNTPFKKGGIQQALLLEEGVQYKLTTTVTLNNTTGSEHKGGCEIKLCGKTEKLSGGKKTVELTIQGSSSAKLELLVNNLQNKEVIFSAISLTKE